jgi:hypothetical protein
MIKKPSKKTRKSKRKFGKWIEENLWKPIIKAKAEHKCELCFEKEQQLHAHHIMRKKSNYMRTLLDNGICLCAFCHAYGIHDPDFDRQREISDKIILYKGKKFMNKLTKEKHQAPVLSLTDLEEVYENLSEILKELTSAQKSSV